ncbi:type II toxin-antitoxin system YafQ family toxin [Pelosinus sp. sgz500959]|uniref:type II toxin-antitoxin system RelE/ParE family toxin n=1 Tax=Pelosinus sp. sgz500959 TaxID=3242472 RepID=UPI00366BFA6F
MLAIIPIKQFQKDLVKAHKRGKNLAKIEIIIDNLANENPLPIRNKDHILTGNYINHRECHIEPDWLLIYKIDEDERELILVRTGSHSHSDLFK